MRKTIVNLNAHQGEVNRLNEMLKNKLHENEALCEKLQVEVVSLRHDLEKKNKDLSQYQHRGKKQQREKKKEQQNNKQQQRKEQQQGKQQDRISLGSN